MEIIEFYNQGAQVQLPARSVDMKRNFSSKRGSGVPTEIGYVPKANSKKADGATHDTLDYNGHTHLLLKQGHVYAVKIGDSDELHTISAEEGHVSLPLTIGTAVEVEEYDADKHGAPAPQEGSEGDTVDTTDPDANATESAAEDAPEGEGTLGNEEGDQTPPIEE